jgi:putative ABC transport system permease protein
MSPAETYHTASRSLRANKMRSLLTMLGIVIGVASVVAMIAIGAGARVQIEEQIRTLGANVLMILPEGTDQGGDGTTLSEADAAFLASEAPSIQTAAPSILSTFQIVAGNRNWRTGVNGTTPAYFVIREWGVAVGRYFTDVETAAGEKVALLGATVAEELFDSAAAAIGQDVRILNSQFTVIGVLAKKGASGTGRDQDDVVFLPITAAKQRLVGGANQLDLEAVDYILAKAVSDTAMPLAIRQASLLLRIRHGLHANEVDDFRVRDPAASMQAQTASADVLTWLLGSVAGVSLLVGGISIMNIMLVSVTERRREIGLRMALGARRRDIRLQFLVEALALCLLGGITGVAFGIGSAVAISLLAGWPVFVSPGSIVLAVGFAAAVGVVFGYFPAAKAAAEDPIACLRSE